jgi:hypothetical protein
LHSGRKLFAPSDTNPKIDDMDSRRREFTDQSFERELEWMGATLRLLRFEDIDYEIDSA